MEVKAILKKPYTEVERMDFIVQYSHGHGYDIEELDTGLRAIGYTQTELNAQKYERIQNLAMTRGDMFEALILAFDKDENDIISIVENMEGITDTERKLYLNRVKNALDFYRKHPAVDLIGKVLGVTSDQMDNFFQSKDYRDLLPREGELNDYTGG